MPDLKIQVESAQAVPFAAVPTIAFGLSIVNSSVQETVYAIALRCQIQIEVTRRTYTPEEQARLSDLFGQPERWGQTLRNLLWTHSSIVVPAFAGDRTTAEMNIPCTFDFNVAATKYFDGLASGEIPLLMLFSGTVFYAPENGTLQVAPISWELESRFRLEAAVWKDMMAKYYPNSVWINLRRDVFDQLYEYKIAHGIPTWEQALERIVANESAVKS